MVSNILQFPPHPHIERLNVNLWLLRLCNTPEADAQRQTLINQLREAGQLVPSYMKGRADEI